MNFRPDLAQLVLAGTKTVTRRLASPNPRSTWSAAGCRLRVGADYAVCPGRGRAALGRVRILNLDLRPLGHLDEAEAHREGFSTAAEFETAFAGINGAYDPQSLVWRVEFQPIP